MSLRHRIIGGGVNGLVTAALLARAGRKVLVLERSDRVGGCAAHHRARARLPLPDPRTRGRDRSRARARARPRAARTADHPPDARRLRADAGRTARWSCGTTGRAAEEHPRVLGDATPNSIRAFSPASRKSAAVLRGVSSTRFRRRSTSRRRRICSALLKTGRPFRALGKADAYRLLRWMPMAVADLAERMVRERAAARAVAAGGVLGSFLGPRSAGSAALLLLLGAGEGHPVASGWFAVGGPGALAEALAAAARQAGVEISTAADVARSTSRTTQRPASR